MARYIVHVSSMDMVSSIREVVERELGGHVVSVGRTLPYLVVELPRDRAPLLMGIPGVVSVEEEREAAIGLSLPVPPGATVIDIYEALVHVNIPLLWEAGATGRGVRVAVIDSGVCDENPSVRGLVAERAVLAGGDPCTGMGHGTWVAAAIAGREVTDGDRRVLGAAPGVELIDVKVLDDEGKASNARVLEGLDAALSLGAKVVNLSLGIAEQCCSNVFAQVMPRLVGMGVIPVVAAGNQGPAPMTVGCPASLPSVITVGASSVRTPRPDTVAWFSSRGPGCGVVKPDLVAPGGAGDENGVAQPVEVIYGAWGQGFAPARGTSMSTPLVTGFIALALELYGDMGFEQARKLVSIATRRVEPVPSYSAGWGVLDASRLPGKQISILGPALIVGGVLAHAYLRGA